MKEMERYAIVLSLMDKLYNSGNWCGETHVQKSTYFLEALVQIPLDFGFTLYKHGPYSFVLHDSLEEMRSLMFFEYEQKPPYGPRLRISERGQKLVAKYGELVTLWKDRIDRTVSCLYNKGVQDLEKLGTALFVYNDMPDADVKTRAKKLNKLKPHISLDDAECATSEFDELRHCMLSGECITQ